MGLWGSQVQILPSRPYSLSQAIPNGLRITFTYF